ncbi:MAG TPA: hypothetical protein PK926_17560 [Spirochaetota bacterium]|nr:hypothetical protein [Spirochaetota bacterium]HPI91126.1 hypothetical protein [Spirochaetota bacterium]HPR49982.1 hypothetical protein [Spirochaetota bacterium]
MCAADITEYIPCTGDRLLKNPYLDAVIEAIAALKEKGGDVKSALYLQRQEFITEYAFSIPVYPILEAVARFGPIVELGAGTGYWAWCLHQIGVDVVAIEKRPPGEENPWLWNEGNRWFNDTWFPLVEGDERALRDYPERTLLMAWPEIHDPMAANALRLYRNAGGRRLLYIGDPGSSGDEAFHRERALFPEEMRLRLPGWPGVEEWMFVHLLLS